MALLPGLADPLCLDELPLPLPFPLPAPPDIGVAFLEELFDDTPLDPDFCLLELELDG